MKQIFYAVAIFVLLIPVAVSAHTQHAFTVYNYQDSWYSDNYQSGITSNGFASQNTYLGSNTDALVPHLHSGISSPPSSDPSQNRLYFDVDRTATVPFVSEAWAEPIIMPLSEYPYSVSFDWNASIRSGFRLELQRYFYTGTENPWETIWSVTPSITNYSGHVSTEFYGNGSRFVLIAVPEPTAFLTLLCGLGGLVWRRRK